MEYNYVIWFKAVEHAVVLMNNSTVCIKKTLPLEFKLSASYYMNWTALTASN